MGHFDFLAIPKQDEDIYGTRWGGNQPRKTLAQILKEEDEYIRTGKRVKPKTMKEIEEEYKKKLRVIQKEKALRGGSPGLAQLERELSQAYESARTGIAGMISEIGAEPGTQMEKIQKTIGEPLAPFHPEYGEVQQKKRVQAATQAAMNQTAAVRRREAELMGQGAIGAGSPVSDNDIQSAFQGARLSEDDVIQAVLDITNKYNLDLDKQVDFVSGVNQLRKDEFPDTDEEWDSYWQQLYGKNRTALDAQQAQVTVNVLDQDEEREKTLHKEIADAQELQNWPAVVLFVLLSYVLGPKSAFLFFSNARKKKSLGLELERVKARIADRKRLEQIQAEHEEWIKKQAILYRMRKKERRDEREHEQLMLTAKHESRMIQLGKKPQTDDNKATIDALDDGFKRAIQLFDFDKARRLDEELTALQERMNLNK